VVGKKKKKKKRGKETKVQEAAHLREGQELKSGYTSIVRQGKKGKKKKSKKRKTGEQRGRFEWTRQPFSKTKYSVVQLKSEKG